MFLVLVPFPLDEESVAKRRAQTAEAELRPGLIYEFRPVVAGPTSFTGPHDWMLLDVAILEAGLNAEEVGCIKSLVPGRTYTTGLDFLPNRSLASATFSSS